MFVWVICLFSKKIFSHFSISYFALFVVAGFMVTTCPRFARFSAILACCLLVFRLWDSARVLRCLFYFLFFFCCFFSLLLCWFPLFSVFGHFCNTLKCDCSCLFYCCLVPNVNSCCLWVHGGSRGTPRTLTIPLIFSVVVMWWPHHPCGDFPPTHACTKYVLLAHQLLFLPCFAFAACPCIPLHPPELIPTLLSLSLPLCVCMHTCVFWGGISRACMPQKHTLSTHLCLCLPRFAVPPCPLTPLHPYKPICIRPHPSAPARTPD